MISIIIPLYNKENCIKETINSILTQSYKDLELVIVNDGSTDDSAAVVKSIEDNRIRIIDKQNEGVSKTRNRGIEESQGEWVMFLDADDILEEGCLQSLIDLHNLYPTANILSGDYITQDKNKSIHSSKLYKECILDDPFKEIWQKKWHLRLGSFIAKKKILPFFEENMKNGEDVLFCYEIVSNGIVATTPHIIMRYIRDNSTLSRKNTLQNVTFFGI